MKKQDFYLKHFSFYKQFFKTRFWLYARFFLGKMAKKVENGLEICGTFVILYKD